MRSLEKPTVSAISHTFNQRSVSTRLSTFVTLSYVVAIETRYVVFYTVVIEREQSLYTASKRLLISMRDLLSKNKKRINNGFGSKISEHARFYTSSKQNFDSDSA